MSLQRALLLLIGAALLVGILPAGIVLDRQLSRELESRARQELALAPQILAERNRGMFDALMMRAKEVAHAPGLGEAVGAGDTTRGIGIVEAARGSFGSTGVLVDRTRRAWIGPRPDLGLLEATRRGRMPVDVVADERALYVVGLAPVQRGSAWVGAAGVAVTLDSAAMSMLAALTHSDVVIVGPGGRLAAFVSDRASARAIADRGRAVSTTREVVAARFGNASYLLMSASFGERAVAIFARPLRRELAVVPQLRRVVGLTSLGALATALLLGALLALRLARPVRSLADAAKRLATDDFEAPLARSGVSEIDRVAVAFDAMRRALRARLGELRAANQTLAERQERLMSLQAELIHRERLAASSRLVAELAHEIRNPVANLRNCLELVHRRVANDPEALEFTNIAIDELLRMHELAERMLDLNRPRADEIGDCDAVAVVREVAAFARLGLSPDDLTVTIACSGDGWAAIPPDMLKQVLLNLVQNAREAMPHGLKINIDIRCPERLVTIDVADNGPGIEPEVLPRLFDPFFTTKASAGGIGLGLFLADGIVRKYGGRIMASNRSDRVGARFLVELPATMETPERAAPSTREQTLAPQSYAAEQGSKLLGAP